MIMMVVVLENVQTVPATRFKSYFSRIFTAVCLFLHKNPSQKASICEKERNKEKELRSLPDLIDECQCLPPDRDQSCSYLGRALVDLADLRLMILLEKEKKKKDDI